MCQVDRIKLIIWDLDDTFWQGTLSEGEITIPENRWELLISLTDMGIVNSICSKNDAEQVQKKLIEEKLDQFFVFLSVSWESKGYRVRDLIAQMQLRAENVLFLDDNPSNRAEVAHFCSGIMTEDPQILVWLEKEAAAAEKKDKEHKRLAQYRLLEAKKREQQKFASNHEFLRQSGIQLEIKHNCIDELDRIHELILRTNQLNFTKVRSTEKELKLLFECADLDCGYISVKDNFGDYGIVGFYACRQGELIHFVFSCRILGMGIEQYVYNWLGRPKLTLVGETISNLSNKEMPDWINQTSVRPSGKQMRIQGLKQSQVLVKGPCDLFQVYPYIADTVLFDTEFTYITDQGFTVESTGHTTNIVESLRLSKAQKQRVLAEVPFAHEGMYCDNIFRKNYRVVFISILADANLGVYRRKETGERFAFLEYIHPITDPAHWEKLIRKEYPTSGFDFSEEVLRAFSEEYEYVGRNTPEQIVENLQFIRAHLPENCVLAVMLGGELYYEKNTFEAYTDRHLVHREVNARLRAWAEGKDNIYLMDVNRYLKDQSSFYDHFNHYIKPVYYALAAELVELVNGVIGSQIRETTKLKMGYIWLKEKLAPIYYKIRKLWKK